ncbi:MAG: histidinol-phosphate transaminase [Candidatus Omnitrophica bacterium]|nr:histidinol-phosphate transaminase [Candidatus Omnitrophota bacterium]
MSDAKKHLKDIYRTPPKEGSRLRCLRLDMNENPSGLPGNFVKKTAGKINSNVLSSYPECGRLIKKIAERENILPENVSLSNGSDAAIKHIFDAYISEGDRVLLTDPTFAMYFVYCKIFKADVISVPYLPDFSFPEEDFLKALSNDVRMAVIVNPNNPTGSVISDAAIQRIVKKAAEKNALIVIDEAYFYYYPRTAIRLIKKFKNLIVLRTFSKLCGMANARLGYAAASREIVESLRKVTPGFDVNGLAVLFAAELLDSPSIIRKMIHRSEEGKKYIARKLSDHKIEYVYGSANFILIKCGRRTKDIIARLAKKNILVGGNFNQDFLADYMRITTGEKRLMEKFWKAFFAIWRREGRV